MSLKFTQSFHENEILKYKQLILELYVLIRGKIKKQFLKRLLV